VALTINFFIPRAIPGNAVQSMMAKFPNLQPSAYKALEALLGVGHPGSIWSQYVSYLNEIFHFNFGTDVSQYPASVSSLLVQTLPWTITLVGVATVIAFLIGTALGIVAGWRHGGKLDRVLPGLMFLQAIPYFFFALILVELLAIKTQVFPSGQGYADGLIPGWHRDFISSALYHSVLPALTIVLTSIAGCSAIDVDFITSKRSEPLRFEVSMTANKVRDEQGNHLVNLAMTFDVAFPDDDGGRAAAEVLPDAIARSHDRLCIVSRTVEIGTPVATSVADDGDPQT